MAIVALRKFPLYAICLLLCTYSIVYCSFYSSNSISLRTVTVKQDDVFWTTLGNALQANYAEVKPINSSRTFLNAFTQNVQKEQKIVILIDDFDKLCEASKEVHDQWLETFWEIRKNKNLYAIHSIVACGTFSIQNLNLRNQHISPFNVSESLKNPYFSMQQTQRLFDQYAQDEKISIDHDIVKDIYSKSNG